MDYIYKYKDFLGCLKGLIDLKKSSQRALCLGCQIHPSYFSRVSQKKASFSQMQVFKIAQYFSLPTEACDYFFLLWQAGESVQFEEKKFFQEKIQKIRDDKLSLHKKMPPQELLQQKSTEKAESYYSEALTAAIHIYLTIPEYCQNPSKILTALHISQNKLTSQLQKLADLKIITMEKGKITRVQGSIHLEENSETSWNNHINWRIRSIQNLENRETQPGDYHVSVTFSSQVETKHEIKQILREAILKIKSVVGSDQNPTNVQHLNIDLF